MTTGNEGPLYNISGATMNGTHTSSMWNICMNAMLVTKIRDKKYGFTFTAESTTLLLCFTNTNQVAATVNLLTVTKSIYFLTRFSFLKKKKYKCWMYHLVYNEVVPKQQSFSANILHLLKCYWHDRNQILAVRQVSRIDTTACLAPMSTGSVELHDLEDSEPVYTNTHQN